MPKSLLLIIVISILSVLKPTNNPQELIAKSNLYNLQYPQEKVYLHLDRPSYWAKDDIWFKAYVKNSPVKNCNLYVELVNSEGFVVYKRICWLENGLAYGDFHIDEDLPSGIYQIRAYTNWMRNFDEEWFFRKDLVIWNLVDKETRIPVNKPKTKDSDIQFFPEGGTFVAGLQNKIAFKALNKDGRGIDCKGEIVDDSGEKILDFESHHNGMGSFVFVPQIGKKYKAKVSLPGEFEREIKLPASKEEGMVLSVQNMDSTKIQLQVSASFADTESLNFTVVGQSEGDICLFQNVKMEGNTSQLEIGKNKLPGGIIKITLFNSELQPVCERLVFNNQIEVIDLKISTSKSRYVPRDSVLVGIELGQPGLSNLSMSVYNPKEQLRNEKFPNNIISQFLLNSELKGNIENPSFYFKDNNMTTQIALDNVMLTHGYRYFDWEEIMLDKKPEIDFEPESSIVFKGRVISDVFEKPMKNSKVTMMTVKSQLGIYEDITDSLGEFVFQDLFFYDTLQVSIQALNKKGRRNTLVQLDRSSITSPEVNFLPVLYEYKEEKQVETLTYLGESQSNLISRKWSLSDTILLEEISVTAQAKKKDDGLFRIYNEADFVFDMEDQTKLDVGNVFDAIQGRIPGVREEMTANGDVVLFYRGTTVMLYLDGIPADYELLRTFPAEAFDKIELIRQGIFAGVNYDGGILFFYTKRGEKFVNMPSDKAGMKSAKIVGYSPIRRFYSPKYETTKQPSVLDDFRNTIYWNPIIQTNENGFGFVKFHNSDERGDMQIIVEGVSADGKLCRGVSRYEVRY